ncbi:MAG: hypothetical protein WCO51_00545 [bacterium]
MARLTLLIGLIGIEVDCPVNTREEAEKVIEDLRSPTAALVRLPGVSFIKTAGVMEMGSRGVITINPAHVMYTQILGVDD